MLDSCTNVFINVYIPAFVIRYSSLDTYRINSRPLDILSRMKYLPLAFSSVNWCKIDVFTSNIMVLHRKLTQTVKIKVNRYTNIYSLINLFKLNQFIFIFPVVQLYFHSYNKKKTFNHFVFLLLVIV